MHMVGTSRYFRFLYLKWPVRCSIPHLFMGVHLWGQKYMSYWNHQVGISDILNWNTSDELVNSSTHPDLVSDLKPRDAPGTSWCSHQPDRPCPWELPAAPGVIIGPSHGGFSWENPAGNGDVPLPWQWVSVNATIWYTWKMGIKQDPIYGGTVPLSSIFLAIFCGDIPLHRPEK